MPVRIDKWLQVARVFKTRTQATKACSLGRVRSNDVICKPHRPVALEDRVEIRYGDWTRVLIVKELRDRPLPKAEASRVYEEISPPRPERRRDSPLGPMRHAHRERGAGRPTKRERRRMERLKG